MAVMLENWPLANNPWAVPMAVGRTYRESRIPEKKRKEKKRKEKKRKEKKRKEKKKYRMLYTNRWVVFVHTRWMKLTQGWAGDILLKQTITQVLLCLQEAWYLFCWALYQQPWLYFAEVTTYLSTQRLHGTWGVRTTSAALHFLQICIIEIFQL